MNPLPRLLQILPHVVVVLALTFLTFTVLDWYNPLMGFTSNALSGKLLVLFCLTSILVAVENILLIRYRRTRRQPPRRKDQ